MKPGRHANRFIAGARVGHPAIGVRLALAASVLLAFAPTSQAQEPLDGATIWGEAGCSACHGNLAAGDGDPANPAGPNLRRTRLDRDQIVETISCGRPGTPMPTHLTGAYTEVSCYGEPIGPVPADVVGVGFLSAEEIQTLVNFLMENVVGQSKITRQNCAMFNGGNENAPECLQY